MGKGQDKDGGSIGRVQRLQSGTDCTSHKASWEWCWAWVLFEESSGVSQLQGHRTSPFLSIMALQKPTIGW